MILAALAALALVAASPEPRSGEASRNAARRGTADVRVIAAGDVGCDPTEPAYNDGAGSGFQCRMRATSDLWVGDDTVDAVLGIGDLQEESGTLEEYREVYRPTWGRGKEITFPAIGNHDYKTPGAAGYFAYWKSQADPVREDSAWYSFDLGTWHLLTLDSNCREVGCGSTSAQGEWLARDLRRNEARCTLAYFHHPALASTGTGVMSIPTSVSFLKRLHRSGVDVLLVAHHHAYERFAPLDGSLAVDAAHGVRQFVVGTGGASTAPQTHVAPHSRVRVRAPGVLDLRLRDGSYRWRFLTIAGEVADRGTADCVDPAA